MLINMEPVGTADVLYGGFWFHEPDRSTPLPSLSPHSPTPRHLLAFLAIVHFSPLLSSLSLSQYRPLLMMPNADPPTETIATCFSKASATTW